MNSDTSKDPIAEKLRQSKEQRKAKSDADEGERDLVAQFQHQADKTAPEELARIEELFTERCTSVNADKDADDPQFQYNPMTHELRAGKQFATYLELTQGFSPYRLDMVSGLRRDANQVFAAGFEPEYESNNWTLFAHMDDDGFYWDCDGQRLTSEEVVQAGLKSLVDNLTR
jgi:hypothetical protein